MSIDHDDCRQEACPNWSGDGNACPCALFGLTVTLDQLYAIGLSRSDVAQDWPELLDDEDCPNP